MSEVDGGESGKYSNAGFDINNTELPGVANVR
jgi:hypothetical protein